MFLFIFLILSENRLFTAPKPGMLGAVLLPFPIDMAVFPELFPFDAVNAAFWNACFWHNRE